MRKIYSLFAMLMVAMFANAQVISFTETAAKGSLNGKTFGSEGFVLTVTDLVDDGKLEIDANNANFGTLADYQSFTHRLKTGGKSSSKNCMSLTIPADGTLKVYARTASKDSERPIVITQGETEVFNQKFIDSQAASENYTASDGSEKTRTVFPVYTCEVKAGTADITYPENGVNFYCFELVSSAAPSASTYEATITSDPENDYYSGYQAFDMKKVIADLGLADEAALAALVNAGGNVYYKSASGELTNAYTGNTNEFWMNINGIPQGYGDEGTCWYAGLYYDEAGSDEATGETWESEFYCRVGQMPEFFSKVYTPSDLKVVLVLKNGDKEAEFAINLKVNAAEEPEPLPEIAEPTRSFAALEVVKQYDLSADFYFGKSYEGKKVSFTLDGIYEALGLDAATLDPNINNVTLVQNVKAEGEEDNVVYSISDALVTPEEGAGGAWFGRYVNYDESTGTEEAINLSLPMGWATGKNTIYAQEIALADGEFSFTTGQYPNVMNIGDKDYLQFYIVNGTKAAAVKIAINVIEEPVVSFDEWVKVGEESVEIKHVLGGAGSSFTLDLPAVAELLGCDPGDVAFNILAGEGALSNDHTATKGGCWMTREGYSITWGTEGYAMYVEPNENMNFTDFSVGFNDAAWTLGDAYDVKLLFNFNGKYFQKTLNVKIVEKEASGVDPDSNFDIVATYAFTQQIVPSGTYYGNESEEIQAKLQKNLGKEYVQTLIGEGTYKVWGLDAPANADAYATLSDAYTYGANTGYNTGFWMADPVAELGEEYQFNSYGGSWADCPYGIEFDYTNCIIGFDQIPNRQAVGDQFRSIFYWANTSNNKAIKLIVTVKYVDEYTESEDENIKPVIENIAHVVLDSEYDENAGAYIIALDAAKALEQLGIAADELSSCAVIVPENEFSFTSGSFGDAYTVDANGYITDKEDKIALAATLSVEDGKLVLAIDDVVGEIEDNKTVTARIGLTANNKAYMYVISLGNATSVSSINASAAPAAIFTTAGAKVNALQKGINIVKKADGSVQKVYIK